MNGQAVTDSDRLPDGTPFAFWECSTVFARTYWVSQKHPKASDENPGTEDLPFRTISRACEVVRPGERVLIDSGIYRECVRPVRGGEGPGAMISFEAVPGTSPIISGAEVWQTDWIPSHGWRYTAPWFPSDRPADSQARVWQGQLPSDKLGATNPFAMWNLPLGIHNPGNCFSVRNIPEGELAETYFLRRGLLFVDDRPLRQVPSYYQLWREPGTFWVEADGQTVHFRLADDSDPFCHKIEFTAREQAFAPVVPYLGYIRVKGLCIERTGNGFPLPQRGALSTFCGHHWVIENNTVRWTNSIGIDIGHQSWDRENNEAAGGWHIVRNNKVIDCGFCGISGIGAGKDRKLDGVLVENNQFDRCVWHCADAIPETASLKLHHVRNGLVRHNIVCNQLYGNAAIWIDYENVNTRVCQNVLMNCHAEYGALFFEASHATNQVDNNVVFGVQGGSNGGGGHGIYAHDCDPLIVAHNMIAHCTGTAICLRLGTPDRIVEGRGSTGRKLHVLHNLLTDCRAAIVMPTPDCFSEGNLFGTFREEAPLRIEQPAEFLDLNAWRLLYGWDLQGDYANIQVKIDADKLELSLYPDRNGQVSEQILYLGDDFCLQVKETVESSNWEKKGALIQPVRNDRSVL